MAPAVLAALIAAGGTAASLLSNSGKKLSVDQYSTMTPEQQAAYSAMLKNTASMNPDYVKQSGYTPEAYQNSYNVSQYAGQGFDPTTFSGGYNPTSYNGNQYQTQMQGALNQSLSGQPSTDINSQATEDYYRQSIEQPALKQYEEQTRPAWMEKVSNLHSSARDNMEQQGYENLYSGLQQQHGNLLYQDEQARRGLQESAMQRQLSGLGVGATMSGQEQNAWAQQNQNLYNQSSLAQNQWGTENQLNLSKEQQAQQQWYNQNQLGLSQNQQNMTAWQNNQQNQLGADQNNLQYQLAQLQQSQIPYDQMIKLLGIQTTENIGQEKGGGIQNILMPWKAF
jgi:hypothetical protein